MHLYTGKLRILGDAGDQAKLYRRDQIRQNVLVKQYYCDIDIAHLISYNEGLAHSLTTEPADIIPLVGDISSQYLEPILTTSMALSSKLH